jgi:hypothetical protein
MKSLIQSIRKQRVGSLKGQTIMTNLDQLTRRKNEEKSKLINYVINGKEVL